ncbi:MAG: phage portal protein [Deltaproteobacteria bacterium]|nr:phage portal protein [Deltaproteobacteria bacterium]
MNWLQKILNYFKKGHTPFISLIRDTFGRGIISREKAFIESSKGWVFACVNVIGQEIGNIQIKLMRGKAEDDEEDEEIFDHPALDAIFRANSQMTKNELFEITSAHLDLDGNSFWYLLKNEAGKWCGRNLSESFLTRVTLGIEKADALLYPVLCICGGITVIGAGTFISHFDELGEGRGK